MERENGFSPEEENLKMRFVEGTEVKVRRSSGQIEEGWKVAHYHRDSEGKLRAVVSKLEGDDELKKTILLTELAEYN
jgi:hypothetical protein